MSEIEILESTIHKLNEEHINLKTNVEIDNMLESKVQNLETQIVKLEKIDPKCQCSSHLREIETLKTTILHLKIENSALRSTKEYKNFRNLDPYKYSQVGDQSRDINKGKHNKRYYKNICPSKSNLSTNLYSYSKLNQNQPLNERKVQEFKFDIPKYTQSKFYKNRTLNNYELKKTYVMNKKGKWCHKHNNLTNHSYLQSKELHGLTHQCNHQIEIEKNSKINMRVNNARMAPIQARPKIHKIRDSSNHNPKSISKSNLNEESIIRRSPITCHFYCYKGHTSIECGLRRKNNMLNVVWISKSRKD